MSAQEAVRRLLNSMLPEAIAAYRAKLPLPRLDELERENAVLREALKPFAWQTRVSSRTEEVMILNARAALAGSGEK
jgi:hypothetical protein